MKEADLVIANHNLVLSALEVDAGSVLPDPGETVYVFDEAHRLPSKAVEHFAAKHAVEGAKQWVHDAAESARDIVLGLKLEEQPYRDTQSVCAELAGDLDDLYQVVHATKAFDEKRARRFRNGVLPARMKAIGENVLGRATNLQATLLALREQMLARASSEPHLVTRLLAELGFFLGKVENLVDTWTLMLLDDEAHGTPTARWIERHDEGNGAVGAARSAAAAGGVVV